MMRMGQLGKGMVLGWSKGWWVHLKDERTSPNISETLRERLTYICLFSPLSYDMGLLRNGVKTSQLWQIIIIFWWLRRQAFLRQATHPSIWYILIVLNCPICWCWWKKNPLIGARTIWRRAFWHQNSKIRRFGTKRKTLVVTKCTVGQKIKLIFGLIVSFPIRVLIFLFCYLGAKFSFFNSLEFILGPFYN